MGANESRGSTAAQKPVPQAPDKPVDSDRQERYALPPGHSPTELGGSGKARKALKKQMRKEERASLRIVNQASAKKDEDHLPASSQNPVMVADNPSQTSPALLTPEQEAACPQSASVDWALSMGQIEAAPPGKLGQAVASCEAQKALDSKPLDMDSSVDVQAIFQPLPSATVLHSPVATGEGDPDQQLRSRRSARPRCLSQSMERRLPPLREIFLPHHPELALMVHEEYYGIFFHRPGNLARPKLAATPPPAIVVTPGTPDQIFAIDAEVLIDWTDDVVDVVPAPSWTSTLPGQNSQRIDVDLRQPDHLEPSFNKRDEERVPRPKPLIPRFERQNDPHRLQPTRQDGKRLREPEPLNRQSQPHGSVSDGLEPEGYAIVRERRAREGPSHPQRGAWDDMTRPSSACTGLVPDAGHPFPSARGMGSRGRGPVSRATNRDVKSPRQVRREYGEVELLARGSWPGPRAAVTYEDRNSTPSSKDPDFEQSRATSPMLDMIRGPEVRSTLADQAGPGRNLTSVSQDTWRRATGNGEVPRSPTPASGAGLHPSATPWDGRKRHSSSNEALLDRGERSLQVAGLSRGRGQGQGRGREGTRGLRSRGRRHLWEDNTGG
jgi:hypothetical protein